MPRRLIILVALFLMFSSGATLILLLPGWWQRREQQRFIEGLHFDVGYGERLSHPTPLDPEWDPEKEGQ